MLKLNASFSKKVPAESRFSSKSFHASVEVEIPDGLTHEQLQGRIHETFQLVQSSVESEINSNTQNTIAYPNGGNQRPVQGNPSQGNGQGYQRNQKLIERASQKQIKYLTDLANENNIPLDGYLQGYGISRVEDLNRQACSTLINLVRQQAA